MKRYYQVHVVLMRVVEPEENDDYAAHEYEPEAGTTILEEEEVKGYIHNFESEDEARKVFNKLSNHQV